MRTTLNLDQALMLRLVKASHAASKTEAIHVAAQEYLAMLARERLIQRFGRLKIEPVYRKMRAEEAKQGSGIAGKLRGVKLRGR